MSSCGLLWQWIHEHQQYHGGLIGGMTREAALHQGAPLQCSKQPKIRRGASGFTEYQAEIKRQRFEESGSISKTESIKEGRDLAAQWHALTAEQQQRYKDRQSAKQRKNKLEAALFQQKEIDKTKCRLGLSDKNFPLSLALFEEAVHSAHGRLGGFTSYGPTLRNEFLSKLFVKDSGGPSSMALGVGWMMLKALEKSRIQIATCRV